MSAANKGRKRHRTRNGRKVQRAVVAGEARRRPCPLCDLPPWACRGHGPKVRAPEGATVYTGAPKATR